MDGSLIPVIGGTVAGTLTVAGAVAYMPARKWIRKCKRRRGGVYLVRVDHHRNRARRVTGYVGETVSYHLRKKQHLGVSRFDPVTGMVTKNGFVKVASQPWSDLKPVWYQVIPLPWWLCWKWVLRPLETLVVLCTWPVYNDAKNRWNPRRITKSQAQIDRVRRDNSLFYGRVVIRASHIARVVVQVLGGLLILAGAYGWVVTR